MENREKVIIKTSFVGIIGNILLVIGKAIVGLLASSISIILDAVNNLTDTLSSIITIVGTKLSTKKPDKKHPYGHGRLEYVTSTLVSVVILFAGFLAIYESIKTLISPEETKYDIYSFIVIGIAIVGKIALGIFFRIRAKKTDSDALKASGIDALMDALLSTSTLVAALITYFTNGSVKIEGYVGILIGLFILKSGIEIMRDSISKIVGERVDNETINLIKKDILELENVKGVYDLILNNYGKDRYIGSVHVEVDDHLRAGELQIIERQIATICYEKYNIIMTVGFYALNESDPFSKEAKIALRNILKDHKEVLQMHGFYVDKDRKIISFDLIFDFSFEKVNDSYNDIKQKMKSIYPEYEIVIIIDKDFSLSSE